MFTTHSQKQAKYHQDKWECQWCRLPSCVVIYVLINRFSRLTDLHRINVSLLAGSFQVIEVRLLLWIIIMWLINRCWGFFTKVIARCWKYFTFDAATGCLSPPSLRCYSLFSIHVRLSVLHWAIGQMFTKTTNISTVYVSYKNCRRWCQLSLFASFKPYINKKTLNVFNLARLY